MHDRKKQIGIYCLAFLIPVFLVMIFFMLCGISPFGDNGFINGDMDRQYVNYYSYLKTILEGKNDILYTFSKTLGGDMLGLTAYYLHNPALLLLLLFPGKKIAAGLAAVAALHAALSGLSSSLLLNKRYGYSYASLLFSTAYALCGYFAAYIINFAYFSCIIILPVLLIFMQQVIEDGKGKTALTVALAVTIFMNYYQAYMIMLFLGFFYLTRLIIDKKYFRSAGDLLLCVINSVMLAFFSLLPTVISLRGEKSMSEANFGFFRKFAFLNFFSGFYSGSTRNDLLPQVYCSVAAVMLMIVFFISKKIGLREKAADLCLLAILAASMCINIIDAVWHGFNNPVGFPWRYSYVLCLTIVVIAYRGFLNGMKKLSVTVVGGISMLFLIACFASGSPYIDRERFIINLLLVALITVCLLLFLSTKGKVRGFILGLLMFVSFSDMVYNTFVIYRYMNVQVEDEEKDHISEFEDAYDEMKEAIDIVKESDRDFYRLEKTFQYAPNDTMLFDYMGLSHSSSCEKSDVRHFMQRMGFRDTGLYAFYAGGSTAFADSFLGVKYLISQWDGLDKDYEFVAGTDKYYIFKNKNALPIAFLTDKDIGAVDAESGITFELQNEIAKASGGAQIFKEAEPSNISLENAEAAGEGVYRKKGDERAFVVYDIDISEEMPLYMYFDSDGLNRSEIFVNDVSKDLYFTETHWNVLCAGRFKKGDRIRIKAEILGDELNISRAGFYYEDMNALDAWHEAVAEDNKENSRIERLSSSHLKYTVSAKEEKTLVMTLPYDKGWHIRVDGKKVDSERILGVLTGVSISKGEHEIEMQYIPQGLIAGMIITLLGVVLLIKKSRPAKSRAAV